jgi:hypothetical protein
MQEGLSPRERERYDTIRSCLDGDITNTVVAVRLNLSVRQVRRLKRAVEKGGERGVVHGLRGRTSLRATERKTKDAIDRFMREEDHRDFGPTFAMEQLARQDIVLSRETVRGILAEQGYWKPRQSKKRQEHRQWRERMPLRGQLVQFDGSYHDWFEDGTEACLLAAIDDATNSVSAVFEDNEGVEAVFRFWKAYVEQHGLPAAVYLDKFSTYKINHPSATDNAELMTQFERAMSELGVTVICANSPEAKGRVERLFGTLQDRLVKELRLRKIRSRTGANCFLADEYLSEHDRRFGVSARHEGDGHRPLSEELRERLPSVFSVQSVRRVNNDFTLRFKNRWLQLAEMQPTTVFKGDPVTVEERLDGSLHLRLHSAYLSFTALSERPESKRMRVTALTKEKQRWVPPANHPWRKAAVAGLARKKSRNRNARTEEDISTLL